MEHYDTIIVGAGIAGCGLAYNLKKSGYQGSVLVIDKNNIGANTSYGYRIIFEETINKYKLPYTHKYKAFHLGAFDQIYSKINNDIYFINYEEICKTLFERSRKTFRKEKAMLIRKNILKTNKSTYKFKHLIDCSGINSFLGKIIKKPNPLIYWITKAKIITNDNNLKDDSFYYMFSNTGFFEEIYPLKNEILHAHWMYTLNPNYNSIIPHNKTLSKKMKIKGIKKSEETGIVPVSPTFPMIFKNYAFLGDSCGQANPADGMGIKPILESSEMLSLALNLEDLNIYTKKWDKTFLKKYTKCVASKLDRYHSSKFIKKIKNYPQLSLVVKKISEDPKLFLNMLKDTSSAGQDIQKKIKHILPKRQIFFLGYNYLILKLKFLLMKHRIIHN